MGVLCAFGQNLNLKEYFRYEKGTSGFKFFKILFQICNKMRFQELDIHYLKNISGLTLDCALWILIRMKEHEKFSVVLNSYRKLGSQVWDYTFKNLWVTWALNLIFETLPEATQRPVLLRTKLTWTEIFTGSRKFCLKTFTSGILPRIRQADW